MRHHTPLPIMLLGLCFVCVSLGWAAWQQPTPTTVSRTKHKGPALFTIQGQTYKKARVLHERGILVKHMTPRLQQQLLQGELLYLEAKRMGLHRSLQVQRILRKVLIAQAKAKITEAFRPTQKHSSSQIQSHAQKHWPGLFHPELRKAVLLRQSAKGWTTAFPGRLLPRQRMQVRYGKKLSDAIFAMPKTDKAKTVVVKNTRYKILLRSVLPALTPSSPQLQQYLKQKYLKHLRQEHLRHALEALQQRYHAKLAPLRD